MLTKDELRKILFGPWAENELPFPQNAVAARRKKISFTRAAANARRWEQTHPNSIKPTN